VPRIQEGALAALAASVAISLVPGPAASLFEYSSATVASLNSARAVARSGTTVYLGDGTAGIRSFDASNPAAPVEGGGVDTPGFVLGITVAANRLFVADFRSGLRILDITDPLAPFERGSQANLGEAWSVAVWGARAYVADGLMGVRVVDISDQALPVEDHNVPLGGCFDVAAAAGKIYAACTALHILDASSPGQTPVLALPLPEPALAVVVAGAFAYVVSQNQGVLVVDVSDPAAPFVATPGLSDASQIPSAIDLAHSGDRLVVTERNFGIHVLDVSRPEAPTAAGSLATATR
jgi:hypothetical protein